MSRFTKAERHEIYKAAKKELIDFFTSVGHSGGICSALYWVAPDWGRNDLPEFETHEPHELSKYDEAYWWSRDEEGYHKRLEVLDDCIEKTK